MKNLTDLRKTVEIGADRRSASARDYSMERFKRDVKKILFFTLYCIHFEVICNPCYLIGLNKMRFRRADSLVSSGKKADSLGMCRWPLRAPTPLQSFLWPIIDPVFVTFGQICNFRDPNSVTFYLCIYLTCPIF